MFSVKQKRHIAAVIEKTLLDLNHPEMPKEKVKFAIHIEGKESWSWASIEANWVFDDANPPSVNPHNEQQDKNEDTHDS